jgi:hypothetical protein
MPHVYHVPAVQVDGDLMANQTTSNSEADILGRIYTTLDLLVRVQTADVPTDSHHQIDRLKEVLTARLDSLTAALADVTRAPSVGLHIEVTVDTTEAVKTLDNISAHIEDMKASSAAARLSQERLAALVSEGKEAQAVATDAVRAARQAFVDRQQQEKTVVFFGSDIDQRSLADAVRKELGRQWHGGRGRL